MTYQADTFFEDLDESPDWEMVEEGDEGPVKPVSSVCFLTLADSSDRIFCNKVLGIVLFQDFSGYLSFVHD